MSEWEQSSGGRVEGAGIEEMNWAACNHAGSPPGGGRLGVRHGEGGSDVREQ